MRWTASIVTAVVGVNGVFALALAGLDVSLRTEGRRWLAMELEYFVTGTTATAVSGEYGVADERLRLHRGGAFVWSRSRLEAEFELVEERGEGRWRLEGGWLVLDFDERQDQRLRAGALDGKPVLVGDGFYWRRLDEHEDRENLDKER
jgi:hypothetical protein